MEKKRDNFFLSNKKEKNQKTPKEKFQKKERETNFDKNRNGLQKEENSIEKKPFDKKAYRLKKYSKKYKLEQWEEQRKKKMLHQYQKSIKNDPLAGKYVPKSFDEDVTDANAVGRFVRHPDLIEKEEKGSERNIKKNSFLKAKDKLEKAQQEKLEKKQAKEKAKEERQQKLQEYKKKKQERFKKLSKKTKKGQPIMTGRLEMLLDKIQQGS